MQNIKYYIILILKIIPEEENSIFMKIFKGKESPIIALTNLSSCGMKLKSYRKMLLFFQLKHSLNIIQFLRFNLS